MVLSPYTTKTIELPGGMAKAVDATSLFEVDEAWERVGGSDDADTKKDTFRKSVGLLHRCLDVRVSSLAMVPWDIMRGDTVAWSSDGVDDEVPAGLEWLETLPALMGLTEAALCIGSQAFMQIAGQTAPKWLAPSTMTPEWDADNGLSEFTRRLGPRKTTLAAEDVLYIWKQDPMHETKPAPSPVDAALAAAGMAYGRDFFSQQYFNRGAARATLLAVSGNTSKTERDKLESWWNRFMAGLGNAFRGKVLNADAIQTIQIGDGLEALADGGLNDHVANDISATMGVPLVMLRGDAANYATATQSAVDYWRLTILPDCDLIARAINKQWLNPLGYHLRFAPQRMDVFQSEEHDRSQSAVNLTQAVILAQQAGDVRIFYAIAETLGLEIPDEARAILDSIATAPAPVADTPAEIAPAIAASDNGQKSAMWEEEAGAFRRWCKNRENPDIGEFNANHLTYYEKLELLAEVSGGAGVYDWRNYP